MHCVISQILLLVLKTTILGKISTEERAKKKEGKKKRNQQLLQCNEQSYEEVKDRCHCKR